MRDRLPVLAFLVAVALLAAHSATLQPWTLDDAYITFRYAEHLAAGHGPVYNVGERVEGYTTFLWMALLAGGHAVGAHTETLSKVLGVAAAGGTLGLLARPPAAAGLDGRGAGAAVLALGSCGMFTAWVMSGMEVALVMLLATASWYAHLSRRPLLTGVVGALATATRPDGVLVVAVQAADLVWRRDRAGLVRLLGAFSVIYGPYFVWRWTYYGWLLPNTFYAKVGSSWHQVVRGLDYVLTFLGPGALLLAGATLALVLRRRHLAAWWPPAAWVVLHTAYIVAVGGDVMPAFRFFAPVLPVLAVAFGWGVQQAADRWWPAAAAGLGVLVAFQLVMSATHDDLRRRIVEGTVGRNGKEVGRWLATQVPPDTLIATNTAGSVPYFSRLPAIDMLGLNDAHIAHSPTRNMGRGKAGHEKADGAYVLSRSPDLVLFGAARGRRRPGFQSDRELHRQPGFRQDYALESYTLPSGAMVHLWRRRDGPRLHDAPR